MAKKKEAATKTLAEANLDFWESVMTTDPKHTKAVGFGRKFTSINAQYQIQEMTRAFGMIGQGWGITDEYFHSIFDNLLSYQAKLWYSKDGNTFDFPVNSSIQVVNNNGKLDDEVYKKVSTDALTKGLSKLGFNADVFLGMWDDNRYVSRLTETKEVVPVELPTLNETRFKAMKDAISKGNAGLVKDSLAKYKIPKAYKEELNKLLA